MSVTIQQIVQDALGILGEVTGVGTQLYSEPRMIKDAGRAFNMLFKKHWWKQYTTWQACTLDGVTGTVVPPASFINVIDFDDFAAVHRDKVTSSLPTLPEAVNPFTVSGTVPRFWTSLNQGHASFATKKIQIVPLASIGVINVKARQHPLPPGTEWANATAVEMDRDLLAFGTAFVALSGDDLNPQAKADIQSMMDSKYRDIMNSLANQKTGYGGSTDLPRNWFTNPY